MARILTNYEEITAPAPPARRYGLLTAAASVGTLDGRGVSSGYQFEAPDCGMSVVPYDPTCAPPHAEKEFPEGTDFVEADPYWLVATYKCGTVGTSRDDVRRRVQARYRAGVQNQLEAVVWDGGGLAVTPTLTGAGATIVIPLVPGAGAAVSALENAFYGAHGYLGTIHVSTVAQAAVEYAQMAEGQGGAGQIKTPLGSVWSFGAGYDITGPANVAPSPGFAWAFMTPAVHLWSTSVDQPDPAATLDRTLNQWYGLAETVWMHRWLCDTVFAVQIPVAAPAVATAPAVPV